MKKRSLFYILISLLVLLIAEGGSQAVTVFVENAPLERSHCVIIDAGHGGVDGGATSCAGILESSYNLNICLRLNDLLHLLGHHTKMIRSADVSIYTSGNTIAQKKISDLKERVRIVNETENAVLVSIHQNNFSDSRYHGAQVFYSRAGFSELLANMMQSAFISTINPGSKRTCKRSQGIYLMDHIQRTGILIECGFLSNVQEEALLRSDSYQKKLVCVVGATINGFLSNA